ncbi:uncharacterized protein [Bactrocera oleae]|uniref:uncharacterized protein isoform X2 n=1 Tax=Bactrocera oleae TaxID=104688 RepID=UPI00387E3EFF
MRNMITLFPMVLKPEIDIRNAIYESKTNLTFEGNNILYNIQSAEQQELCKLNKAKKYIVLSDCIPTKQLDNEAISPKLNSRLNNDAIFKHFSIIDNSKKKYKDFASNLWRANDNLQKKLDSVNVDKIEKALFAKNEISSKDIPEKRILIDNSFQSPENGCIINTFQRAEVYKKPLESCCGLQFNNNKYRNYLCNNSLIDKSCSLHKYERFPSKFRRDDNLQIELNSGNDFKTEKVIYAKNEISSKDICQKSNSFNNSSEIPENYCIIDTFQNAKVYKKTEKPCCSQQFDNKYPIYECSYLLITESCLLNNYESLPSLITPTSSAPCNKLCTGSLDNFSEIFITITTENDSL